MTRPVPLTRLFLVLLAALIAGALAAPGTALAAPVRFYADSGDACPYGVTTGTIDWHLIGGPIGTAWADIAGTLTDQPAPISTGTRCAEDGRYSVATFTASSISGTVARVQVGADNEIRSFAFTTGTSASRIVRITIQVCRPAFAPGPFVYCGPEVVYRAPLTF